MAFYGIFDFPAWKTPAYSLLPQERDKQSPTRMAARFPFKILISCTAFPLLALIFLFSFPNLSYPPRANTPAVQIDRARIPNIVHFVYVLRDPNADFALQFSQFLSIYAASHRWQPDAIYLHTNADESRVIRAREGDSGKWNRLVFNTPGLIINYVTAPTHANNGKEIKKMEHRSDFVRVKVVHDFGGIYIDWDIHALRDVKILRDTGFKAIAGRQVDNNLNSGSFMSEKGGKMIRLWMEGMHQVYNGGWTVHSNDVLRTVGQRLVREPGEMLIMDREAFAPIGWEQQDAIDLFGVHDETESNLAGLVPGNELPSHDENLTDRWDHPEAFPSWARDWSDTYLLHAFKADRFGITVPGFHNITPRYVLERRSNFARAVYPVAKMLYDQGIINIEDPSV